MSIVASGSSASYSPVQDRAISEVGAALRASMQQAIASPPNDNRTDIILQRIAAALRAGHANEGVFVSIVPYTRMFELLTLLPRSIDVPEIVVESENQIALDWDLGARQQLSLTINGTTFIGYAALIGHEPIHGRAPFAGTVPETVAHLLQRLFPVSQHGRQRSA